MAGVLEVAGVVRRIAEGFGEVVLDRLSQDRGLVVRMVREQIYSGLDSAGRFLSPTYDADPYFNEPGQWQGKAYQYKLWKRKITPPIRSYTLNLPPRPDNVPNLFITGAFFESIGAEMAGGALRVTSEGFMEGDDIVAKYGDGILGMGYNAREYFIGERLRPAVADFFTQCGYR